jgi:DNA-binding MarR family transcriptional regulator
MPTPEEIESQREFVKAAIELSNARHKVAEIQRIKEGITLTDRERLILKILWARESRGLKDISVMRLATVYNNECFKRNRTSESSISATVRSLKDRKFVETKRDLKKMNVTLDVAGKEFIEKTKKLMDEWVQVYLRACENPEDLETIKQFVIRATAEFNHQINEFRRHEMSLEYRPE